MFNLYECSLKIKSNAHSEFFCTDYTFFIEGDTLTVSVFYDKGAKEIDFINITANRFLILHAHGEIEKITALLTMGDVTVCLDDLSVKIEGKTIPISSIYNLDS